MSQQPALTPPDGPVDQAAVRDIRGVLGIRAFRRLWIALGLSSLGDWLGLLALTAMARELASDSYSAQSFAIAGVLFLRVLPAVVIGPLAGYVADRLDRRLTMVVGDLLRFGLFVSIPLVDTLTWLFVATVLIEAVSLVWLPAKDATVPNLVPREGLAAANQVALATTYGSALPAAAVFTVLTLYAKGLSATLGPAAPEPVSLALFVNAATFLVSAATIWTLRDIGRARTAADAPRLSIGRTVVEGWAFVARTPEVRGLVVGIVGAFAAAGVVIGLGRVYVADLGAGEPAYGVLFGAIFAGLAAGMWFGPKVASGLSRRRLFGVALTLAGITLAAIALVQNVVLVLLFTVLLGMWGGMAWIVGYTLLGLEVEDALRGRTFAFVQSLIRIALALVLAIAPAVSGLIGRHRIELTGGAVLDYNGAAITIFLAALVATGVGISSYRQMDDRRGIPLRRDLRRAFGSSAGVYSDRGLFVAFEGGEGVGKSTQAALLAGWLRDQGYDVVETREPGGTQAGRELRAILLDAPSGSVSPHTEALLYAADRAEHVATVIRPALQRGAVVITDRYVDSSLAYQGAGRALQVAEVERISRWATAGLRPHATVVLDLDPAVGLARVTGPADRLEQEPLDFHHRVRQAFRSLAAGDADHYVLVQADRDPGTIAEEVRRHLQPYLHRIAARSVPPPASSPAAAPERSPSPLVGRGR